MAATVTWDMLRDLAGFRSDKGCAISLYLGLDPSTAPTADEVDSRIRSLVHGAERAADALGELGREQREGLRGDLERIRRFFDDEFDRAGTHGLALFACGPDNLWRALALTDPVEDEVKLGAELYLAPLVPLVGKDGALVAVVNRERGDVYRLLHGRLVEVADRSEEQPYGRHDQGGWSQARYQRHVDELAGAHIRRVADEVDRRVRRRPGPVVVVGPEEIRNDFCGALPQDTRAHVVGWKPAEAHATPAQVLDLVRPVLEEWRARREAEAIERWREEAGRDGRAAAGWEQTLEAASDGRVELLLFAEGARREAYQCPECGRAAVAEGSCPLDGTRMERREEGLDLAVHQTLAHGGSVQAVRHHDDLGPVEGVGALLRF